MATFNDIHFGDASLDRIKEHCAEYGAKWYDDCGYSALRASVCGGYIESVKYLVEQMNITPEIEPDPYFIFMDWYDGRCFRGPVDDKLRDGQINCIKYLVDNGFKFTYETRHVDDSPMIEFLETIRTKPIKIKTEKQDDINCKEGGLFGLIAYGAQDELLVHKI